MTANKEFSVRTFKESLEPDVSKYGQVGLFVHKNARLKDIQTHVDFATGDIYYCVVYDHTQVE